MSATLVVFNARNGLGEPVDIVIAGHAIAAIGPAVGEGVSTEKPRIDARGGLVLPGLVDGHVHLDKTLIGMPFIPHIPGGSVAERIRAEKALRRSLPLPVEVRGGKLLEKMAAYGTVACRSHADIDTEVGLAGLEAILSLKQSHGHLVDIQTVAFPQSGVLADPGTADLLEQAVKAGADLIGGLDPAGIDDDITGHLNAIFAIAGRYGVGVDLHLHDPGPLGAFEIRQIAKRALAHGLQGKCAVSHAYCLGALDDMDFGRTAEALARADVAIMTIGPGDTSMPPIKRLKAAGVRVFSGNDNIRDAWSPLGNGDLLERASILCDRQNFRADADLEHAFALVSTLSAEVLGRSSAALGKGSPADFIILPVASIAEAVAVRPMERMVFKAGVLIASNGNLVAS
ncbi:amidohydrolase [Agrobacterium vitis]|uniref:amidohydrolase n=1 Tax=Agrobacterium vitis TaxID=373 RepID=UPI0012E7E6B6|nr:amidohydrolase [Agrobacterium vitis]MVA26977.1 amidohydrolase family protein [Agrobacterium vitis]